MFPFLAPIKEPNSVERQGTIRFVEMTFMADSPYASRSNSAASAIPQKINEDAMSQKSQSNEGLNIRPNSRSKSKTSLSSQPTSARSEKSSPLPPVVAPVKDTIPPISRHKNKGLQMSAGMMELFGGGGGDDDEKKKKVEQSSSNTEAVYKPVENHDAAYERAVRRARGQDLSKPGPEWYEGFNRLDMTDIDLPDPNCPAEKILNPPKNQEPKKSGNGWQDAKEDVLATSSTSTIKFESLPGPDIGDDEEEDELENEEEDDPKMVIIDSPIAGNEPNPVDKGDETEGGRSGTTTRDETSRQSGERRDSQKRDGEEAGRDAEATDNAGGTAEDKKAAAGGGEEEMTLLLKNAQIINDDAIFVSDVLIQNGLISNIAQKIDAPDGVEQIDVAGRMLLPAGIDVHTQLTSPESADDLLTGCRAALAGGTATVIEVVQPRGAEGPLAAFKRIKGSLDKAICNVSIAVAINSWNNAIKSDMDQLVADGVNSFIVAGGIEDDKLFELLEHSRKLGAFVRLVPENRAIVSILERKMLGLGITGPEGFAQSRPEDLEADRVNSLGVLSQLANCPVSIVSVSAEKSLASIEKSRASGSLTHAEIATAAIASDGEKLWDRDVKVALTHLTEAPLRKGASDRLVAALANQPLIVATSAHRAISTAAKLAAKDFSSQPKGSIGVEERMAVIWEKGVRSGKIDAMRFVAVTSSNAAKVFNMYPKKGRIAVGADADLVIWDGSTKRCLTAKDGQSTIEESLYDGMNVHATVVATIVGGRVVWKEAAMTKDAQAVGFLPLTPNSPYLFSMVSQRDKFANIEKVERSESNSKKVQNGHQSQPQHQPAANDFDRTRIRKHLMESSIDFGGNQEVTSRKPSAGRSTGLW